MGLQDALATGREGWAYICQREQRQVQLVIIMRMMGSYLTNSGLILNVT
jgi:hypothetical protein